MQESTAPLVADAAFTIAALRTELGLTLQELGERIGLSKSQMHEVEQSNRASVRVAVAIEELSGGRIDAAGLNEDVRLSRHGGGLSADAAIRSAGNAGELSTLRDAPSTSSVAPQGERGICGEGICGLCERRFEDAAARACTAPFCPRKVPA